MGNAETSHDAPPTVQIPSPAPAGDQAVPTGTEGTAAHGAANQGEVVARMPPPQSTYTSPQQPLMQATRPAVAGLKTIPDMRLRRLMGVSAWALFLASAGLVLGVIALIRMMGDMPTWFEPVFSATGVFGLVLIIAAFITVRYRLVPWMLLGASSVTFAVGILLIGTV